MSTPISSRLVALAAIALLAGCHRPPPGPDQNGNRVEQPIAGKSETPRVACATGGSGMVENGCAVETDADGVMTIRNPDGGFHRLRPTGDGSGLVAADGAEGVQVLLVDAKTIEVDVGGDRYRLPATVKGLSGKP